MNASVSGGGYNTASGEGSSVSAGSGNTAGGGYNSVSGGYSSQAESSWDSVSGGVFNIAKGTESSVTGGLGKIAAASTPRCSVGRTDGERGTRGLAVGGRAENGRRRFTSSYATGLGGYPRVLACLPLRAVTPRLLFRVNSATAVGGP
jgi:hypothetical protein